MHFSLIQLKKMVVETESGIKLGKVFNIIFDTELQNVLQYEVGNYFNKKQYLINQEQIVRFEEFKLVVDDSVKKVRVEEEKMSASTKAEPAMMREE